MSSMMETLLGFAGGLALFIYGMNQMGDGLKKVAERMVYDTANVTTATETVEE
jgi:Na+/phosphate symporter